MGADDKEPYLPLGMENVRRKPLPAVLAVHFLHSAVSFHIFHRVQIYIGKNNIPQFKLLNIVDAWATLCRMVAQSNTDYRQNLDPVFLKYGMEVYTNEYAQQIRAENLDLKKKGKRIWNIIPQEGFQEKVLTNMADIVICGGKRGSGKTAISLIGALYYADNPDVNMYGFRRLENDVRRGIWKSCKPIFRGLASFSDTNFEAKFFNAAGATMKMEHLQDLSKIKDRFRGAEMPYIVIEELAEFTKENLNVIFDLMGSNRSTAGVRPRFICTCNPVGKSNKLRLFLDWWIDPETDEAIPERSGKIRYFCRYGEDVMEIAWGDTPEEVYANVNARAKICSLTDHPDEEYRSFITSLTFIDGAYGDNKILHVSDPKYMNRISSGGSKSTVNDIRGIWRDVDDSGALLSLDDMNRFFENDPQPPGRKVAAADIALVGDMLVLFAADGGHICDFDAVSGLRSEEVIPYIEDFLKRNEVAKSDFTYDTNGIGTWIRDSDAFTKSVPFDNRTAADNKIEYKNIKSECMGRLIDAIQRGKLSIEPSLLKKIIKKGKEQFTLQEILLRERLALKWKAEENPKEIIKKTDMKLLIGHSPDFMETLIYLMSLVGQKKKTMNHSGFGAFIRR